MTYEKRTLEDYFIHTNFYDLMPLSIQISGDLGYNQDEVIEAICKVYDKYRQYPPVHNRTAWFCKVFKEKLPEARSDILCFKAKKENQF